MKAKILIGCQVVLTSLGTAKEVPYSPESVLPAGVDSNISINPYTGESGETRKGTIAATLNNVARLNQLMGLEETPEIRDQIREFSNSIEVLIPSLKVIGMFDFFAPIDWIGDGSQPGRVLVLTLYFKHYPEKCTSSLKEELLKVKMSTQSNYLKQQIEAL